MESITFLPKILYPWILLKIISPTTKQLIDIKTLLSDTHFSPLFLPINNISPGEKLKERIMYDYCMEG